MSVWSDWVQDVLDPDIHSWHRLGDGTLGDHPTSLTDLGPSHSPLTIASNPDVERVAGLLPYDPNGALQWTTPRVFTAALPALGDRWTVLLGLRAPATHVSSWQGAVEFMVGGQTAFLLYLNAPGAFSGHQPAVPSPPPETTQFLAAPGNYRDDAPHLGAVTWDGSNWRAMTDLAPGNPAGLPPTNPLGMNIPAFSLRVGSGWVGVLDEILTVRRAITPAEFADGVGAFWASPPDRPRSVMAVPGPRRVALSWEPPDA